MALDTCICPALDMWDPLVVDAISQQDFGGIASTQFHDCMPQRRILDLVVIDILLVDTFLFLDRV